MAQIGFLPAFGVSASSGRSMGGPQHFCTKCGHELRPGTRFCTTCGHIAALSAEPADQAGADSANRDFTATATRPAPPRRDASRRPWPQAEPRHRLPDESGAASASPEAGRYEPLPQADDQIPNQFRPDQPRPYRFRPLPGQQSRRAGGCRSSRSGHPDLPPVRPPRSLACCLAEVAGASRPVIISVASADIRIAVLPAAGSGQPRRAAQPERGRSQFGQ